MRIASGSLVAALLVAVSAPASATLPADPLASPMWDFVADQAFGAGARVAFDPRVKVRFPDIAENQRVFPVEVDARGIADVKRIVILVDLNPIQLPIDYRLDDAEPFIATRIKLDQRTPVRGAVQLADGSWLVSGGWIDAAGGGCSAPPASRRGGLWRTATGPRAQIAFRHPMDTGFVANIASYYIDQLTLTGADGRSLGMVAMQAAVAEDPVLTLLPHARTGEVVRFHARDTNGIDYRGTLADRGGPAA
jgi:sulfur-oxidizing protein SoxY